MPIAANMLFRRFWYFSKRICTVSLGWRSNSGNVGRFIAIAITCLYYRSLVNLIALLHFIYALIS